MNITLLIIVTYTFAGDVTVYTVQVLSIHQTPHLDSKLV